MPLRSIVLDLRGVDTLRTGTGQYRYAVDLLTAIDGLTPKFHFVVLGSSRAPLDDLEILFTAKARGCWTYQCLPQPTGFPAEVRRQLKTALAVAGIRPLLYHCLSPFVPVLAPCPIVITIQDMMYEVFPEYREALLSRPYRLLKWSTRHRVRRVICPSKTTADDLSRLWHISQSRIDVVFHGLVAFQTVSADDTLHPLLATLDECPVLLSPFNLEPRKNLTVLLEAMARLPEEFRNVRLVLYGKGGWQADRLQHYRETVARLGLEKQIVETGIVSDKELWRLYQRSTLFIFPTLYEGFGYPALEAMAAGCCVIVRQASSMSEVVGNAGISLEPLTPDSLTGAIVSLLRDPQERARLSRAATAQALRFSAESMARGTLDCYLRAIGQTADSNTSNAIPCATLSAPR